VYRIPNSVSTELDGAKQQITIEKAKADALDTKLATAKQAVEGQRSQVTDLQTRVDALGRQIDTDRIYLDRTSQSDIDDFNAKVNRYNTLLRSVRTENATANELIDTYNALVEEAKAQDRVVSQMIDSYNAKLRLYGR
jgi:chromosome segregation ATPase